MTRKMVIVDDEALVIEGIKAIIKRIEADVEVVGSASDGMQAQRVIRNLKPDIVITDIRIPYVDGLSLIEACKEYCPDTYFIIISGFQEFEYARRAIRLDVVDYITKPVTIDKLKAALDMTRKKQMDEEVLDGFDRKDDCQKAESGHKAIDQIVEYISKNYNKEVGLTELSELVGMNPAYLSVLFKETLGKTYIKYLTGIRIEKACQFLLEGNKVSAVASMVGISDVHYFGEIFKKYTGKTPREYRDSSGV
ncbi:MAG: response regulator [Butyrivibrio sp.]|uniref:response regulator transcription factor n=1 Tax=Butyrivibrio sp. TaxID=28121 RepID=UPI001B2672E1|nr:response regulator [Butyrivibrio sp.]MBO6239722.1 response regulator [Butyrivibrio sp.]